MADEWTIGMGDFFEFSVERVREPYPGAMFGTDADLNGKYATKLEAIESVVHGLERTRRDLNRSIGRAKRMLRRQEPRP